MAPQDFSHFFVDKKLKILNIIKGSKLWCNMITGEQSKPFAELKGSARWGGHVNQWTVYLLEVNFEAETWIVYRRFSAFEHLHNAICEMVDPTTKVYLTKNFPEKEFGSLFATMNFVVDKRIQILKRYINLLLMHPQLVLSPVLLSFLDTEDKGKCGIARTLGSRTVMLEAFVDMSLPEMGNMVYITCFVVLTNSGMFYAFNDFYDNVDNAIMSLDLTTGGRIRSDSGMKCEFRCQEKVFYLIFKSQDRMAAWVRAVSDQMMQVANQNSHNIGNGVGHSNGTITSNAKTNNQSQSQQQQKQPSQPQPQQQAQQSAPESSDMFGF